jgi:hypothetical protein
MWARNLLFIGILLGGIALLRASLFPLLTPARAVHFDPGPSRSDDFQAVVRQVNDAFRAEWQRQGLATAPAAADLSVARRLSLALTGTVPSLEEIRQFEAQPPELRIAGWTNYLLVDRRFSDYFAERLARAYVGTEDGRLIAYRRRRFVSWLSDELLKNTSYGDLVRALIATEGMSTDQPPVNFIAVAVEQGDKPNAERLAARVTRAFLGLRLDCAQCHDHFLEANWKQRHFQALAAFFGQTRQTITNVHDGTGEYQYEDRKTGKKVAIEPDVPFQPELLPAQGRRRERLAAWVTHPANVWFARATVNRVWALMFNRPLRDAVEAQTLDEEAPPALDILARDLTAHNYDLHRLIRLIAASEVFHLDSSAPHEITEEHDRAWAAFPMTRMRPEQVIGSVFQAASVQTIGPQSHIVLRAARYVQEKDFIKRYGDTGDDEFDGRGGTIPQRLLLMNGTLVNDKLRPELVNASAQIAQMAPDDRAAVETAYLTVLTRRPTPKEADFFAARLAGSQSKERERRLSDLYWVLFNATEMSWNH